MVNISRKLTLRITEKANFIATFDDIINLSWISNIQTQGLIKFSFQVRIGRWNTIR